MEPSCFEKNQSTQSDPKISRSCLENHKKKYQNSKITSARNLKQGKFKKEYLIKLLRENPVNCTKYNYTLQKELMNNLQFESELTVSEDGSQLIIRNNKLSTNPIYFYDETPEEINE